MPRRKVEDPRSVHERQKDFLKAYANTFSVAAAAEATGITRTCHYNWFRTNPKYRQAFEKRKEEAGSYLEAEAIERAGEGWDEPVYYQGVPCGTVRRFDSGLMQFLLRGMMPAKYGAKTELSGPAGAPLQAKIEVVFVDPADSGNAS